MKVGRRRKDSWPDLPAQDRRLELNAEVGRSEEEKQLGHEGKRDHGENGL